MLIVKIVVLNGHSRIRFSPSINRSNVFFSLTPNDIET